MTDTPTSVPLPPGRGSGLATRLGQFREAGLVAALVLFVVVVGTIQHRFVSVDNLTQVLLDASILAIVVVGQTVVVLTRNVDLSVGSIVGLTAFAVGSALKHVPGLPTPLAILIGCGIGLALGAVNGALVSGGRVPAIVATLGTRSMYRGLVFFLAGGSEITASDVRPSYLALSNWLILFAGVVVVVFAYALRYSRPGRELYAVGSNPPAAKLAGLKVGSLVFGAFVISGLLAGLAGALWTARYASVDASAATGLELQVIAAVVVGGVNIFGGSGSILGAILGTFLLALIHNALILLHINPFWEDAIYGLAILGAVSLDAGLMRRLQSLLRAKEAR
jgi:rhamnose transport system permease protein